MDHKTIARKKTMMYLRITHAAKPAEYVRLAVQHGKNQPYELTMDAILHEVCRVIYGPMVTADCPGAHYMAWKCDSISVQDYRRERGGRGDIYVTWTAEGDVRLDKRSARLLGWDKTC